MSGNGRRKLKVLYVQRPTGGGSTTGLLDLIRSLDRSRVEPTVLFFGENRYRERFEALDVAIRTLDMPSKPPVASDTGSASALADARSVETVAWPEASLHGKGSGPAKHSLGRELRRLVRRELPLARRIAGEIRAGGYDLVHTNDNPRGDRSIIMAAGLARIPSVSHVRFIHQFSRLIDGTLSHWVNRYVYMSEAIRETFEQDVGRPMDGSVIYDPLTVPDADDLSVAARNIRTELGIDGVPVVTNVARIVPWKGLHVFIESLPAVIERHPELAALIVGDLGSDPNYTNRLERMALDLGIADRVHFVGFRPDTYAIMAASDVVVHSSIHPEPFGRVVIEAMAVGTPIVAMRAGGPLESVDDGVSGLLVSPDRSPEMAAAIDRILSDASFAGRIGEEGKRRVKARHAPSRYWEELLGVYEDILQ